MAYWAVELLVSSFLWKELSPEIPRNAIFENGGLGIDLSGDGPTPNNGADLGPDFPELAGAVNYPTRTILRGSLDSVAGTVYAIEFFASPACGAQGYGEGRTYLGTTNLMTDESGHAAFSWTTPVPLVVGHVVTATATDPYGNSSEFSACALVVPYDSADLRVEAVVSGDPVSLSSNFTYPVTVRNFGPTNATGVVLSNVLPANVTFVSAVTSQGSCSNTAGRVTCALGAIPRSFATVLLEVHPAVGGQAELTATVRANQLDLFKRMREVLRGSDLKCRYGGEEFLVLLPETPLHGARRVAETIRREIAERPVPWSGEGLTITASFGIAQTLPSEVNVQAVIARAAKALYRAKDDGRNCVRVAAETGTPVPDDATRHEPE